MAADLKSLPRLAEGAFQCPAAAVQPRRVLALHLQLHFHFLQLQFHLEMKVRQISAEGANPRSYKRLLRAPVIQTSYS